MSTVSAVKTALVSLLTTACPDAQVIDGPPDASALNGVQIISVGRVSGTRELNSLSGSTSEERYVVDLVASVSLPGTEMQAPRDLAMDLYEAAELAIREYAGGANLGLGDGIQALPTGAFELDEQADENGRHAAVRFGVAVIATNT